MNFIFLPLHTILLNEQFKMSIMSKFHMLVILQNIGIQECFCFNRFFFILKFSTDNIMDNVYEMDLSILEIVNIKKV